jgi:hypothetical protein
MCIAIWSPAGAPRPTKSVLKTCNKNNPDGMGFVYFCRTSGKFVSEKTQDYTKFNSWYKHFEQVPSDVDVAIHFRIATCGGVSHSNTHPFVGEEFALIHNGQIAVSHTKTKSDTAVLFELINHRKVDVSLACDLFEAAGGFSKFVIIGRSESFIVNHALGEWDEKTGNWFSNLTYLPYVYPAYTHNHDKYPKQVWEADKADTGLPFGSELDDYSDWYEPYREYRKGGSPDHDTKNKW